MWAESLQALRARPRTLIAGVGMVVVAFAAMVIIPTLTNAAAAKVLSDLDALGSNAWIVATRPVAGETVRLPPGSLARASDLAGVSEVLHQVSTTVPAQLSRQDSRPHGVAVIGLDGTAGAGALGTTDGDRRPVPGLPFGLIGAQAATTLQISSFPAVVLAGGQPIVVTGMLRGDPLLPELSNAVVTETATALSLDPDNATDRLIIREAGGLTAQSIGRGVDPLALAILDVSQPAALVAARAQSSDTLETLGLAASAAAFGIAALGIAIMLTSAVRQRTAELAVRRVHGAPTAAITGLIAAEGLLIGVLGGLAGMAVSNAVIYVVTGLRDWPTSPDWGLQGAALGAALAMCLLASLPPAWVALRVQPARAFAVE